jgi:hypothetical protein
MVPKLLLTCIQEHPLNCAWFMSPGNGNRSRGTKRETDAVPQVLNRGEMNFSVRAASGRSRGPECQAGRRRQH